MPVLEISSDVCKSTITQKLTEKYDCKDLEDLIEDFPSLKSLRLEEMWTVEDEEEWMNGSSTMDEKWDRCFDFEFTTKTPTSGV